MSLVLYEEQSKQAMLQVCFAASRAQPHKGTERLQQVAQPHCHKPHRPLIRDTFASERPMKDTQLDSLADLGQIV